MTKIWQKGDARSPRLGHRPPSISSSGLTPRGEGNWDLRPIATKWANNSLLGPGSLVNPSDCSTTFIFKILILIWERKSVSVCAHGGGQRISFGSQVSLPLGVLGTNPVESSHQPGSTSKHFSVTYDLCSQAAPKCYISRDSEKCLFQATGFNRAATN